MSLVEQIARADERGLAVSGLACLDRCVPLLGGDDEVLRPLWASLAQTAPAGDWAQRLEQARGALDAAADDADEAVALARRMLAGAPAERSAAGWREWADDCYRRRAADPPDAGRRRRRLRPRRRPPRGPPRGPVTAARRRTAPSAHGAGTPRAHGPAGLRKALEVSTEGRRVLRAVVSRRNRRDT
ncbi:hypothetical protein GCM10023238_12210 [Streptomyces heliomycini]